jgi:hypothetical protein
MKNLYNSQDKIEIQARLDRIHSDSPRRWGKMTPAQMICHLSDSFRGPMGERPMPAAKNVRAPGFMKIMALYAPIPWPKGLMTMPEANQEIGGTRPAEFAADVVELRRLLERFTARPRIFTWTPHPLFLQMTDAQWMRWAYLHMDHHFRQFGA